MKFVPFSPLDMSQLDEFHTQLNILSDLTEDFFEKYVTLGDRLEARKDLFVLMSAYDQLQKVKAEYLSPSL